MAQHEDLSVGVLRLSDTMATALAGSATTRANVLIAMKRVNAGIGSTYLSTAGKLYIRVAAADAATDIQKVTASAAD